MAKYNQESNMEYFTDVHFKIQISLIALNESKKVPKKMIIFKEVNRSFYKE